MGERIPAEVFPPGEIIKEELEARSWSQIELAEIMGRPARVVSEIISGKRTITPETARGLGAAFGTGPTFWINVEGAYQLFKTVHDDDSVQRRARLYSKAPVKEMLKRGWIMPSENVSVLERRVCDFLQIEDINQQVWYPHAAYKGKTETELSQAAQWAWLYRAKQIASSIEVRKYSEAALRKRTEEMKALMLAPEEARQVPKILMDCGVKFVVVERLPHADIDGVCFWVDDRPVIGMSLRKDKIDNFWFVLRHEIEHILHGHGKQVEIIDLNLEGERAGTSEALPEEERIANKAAADFCVPADKIQSFMTGKHPFYYERDVLAFARAVNRHPGIVVGQMQFRMNNYAYLNRRISPIRQFILDGSVYDGWGQAA